MRPTMTFKARAKAATAELRDELGCVPTRTQRLYTAYWMKGSTPAWMSPMDTDGLLVRERRVKDGDAPPKFAVTYPSLLGVIIQVEETTARTRPNPYGKAGVVNVPLGLWVDRWYEPDQTWMRERLTHAWVLFVTRDDLAYVISNLENVRAANRDAYYCAVKAKASTAQIKAALRKQVYAYLVGVGRPRVL
jgi:hypothetical protein